jgi:hypothetical protein
MNHPEPSIKVPAEMVGNYLSRTFSSDERSLAFKSTTARMLLVALVTSIVAIFLRPDLFGLVPNGLDPMFYLGYEINLDDALEAAGNKHYFVSRWTSYLPAHFTSLLFGPYWGRLVLRLLMVSVLSEAIWRFLANLEIRAHARLLSVFLLVTSPLFVRAFTTDYPEYFIIWAALLMALLSFTRQATWKRSVLMGALAASISIANPTATILSSFILINYVFNEIFTREFRKVLTQAVFVILSFLTVILLGFILFKYWYGVENIYQPTLDFIKNYTSPDADGWRTPTRKWLLYFGWLYLPMMYSIVAISITKYGNSDTKKVLFRCVSLTSSIFLWHIYLETKSGHALETSFYWSMLLSPALLTFMVVTSVAFTDLRARYSLLLVGIVVSLYILEIPQKLRLPNGYSLIVIVGVATIVLVIVSRHTASISVFSLVILSVWLQVGSPKYAVFTNGGDLNTPKYDLVYGKSASTSNDILRETIWFLKQMDKVPSDSFSTFLPAGGWSYAIVGTYVPHPFGRVVTPASSVKVFSPNTSDELLFGYKRSLVIYGDSLEAEIMLKRVKKEIPDIAIVRDVTHLGGLYYRLIAIAVDEIRDLTIAMPMSRFFRDTGEVQVDGSLEIKQGAAPGWASFGPYLGLGVGEYKAELIYSSPGSDVIGTFEVVNDATGDSELSQLLGNNGQLTTASLDFFVSSKDNTWQFRTRYEGNSGASFKFIRVTKVG